jgi:hypothetical protein
METRREYRQIMIDPIYTGDFIGIYDLDFWSDLEMVAGCPTVPDSHFCNNHLLGMYYFSFAFTPFRI